MAYLTEGSMAPDFSGVDQNGNTLSLQDFKGKKVVLYFYPKDDTPGCTKEACNFRDNHQALQEQGFVVIGVSPDTVESHKKFAEKYHLPFPLIADPDKKIIKAYGVWGKKKFMGREYEGVLRTTYVIDESGKIEKVIRKVDTTRATEQLLKSLSRQP